MAYTFETDEELLAFVREHVRLEMDREYTEYSNGSSTVSATVYVLGEEVAQDWLGISGDS
jgi:hypothetical protein